MVSQSIDTNLRSSNVIQLTTYSGVQGEVNSCFRKQILVMCVCFITSGYLAF